MSSTSVQQSRSQDKPNLSRLPDGTFPIYCAQVNGSPSPYPTSPTATPLSIKCAFPPPAHTFINAVFDEFAEVENLSELGLQVSRYEFYINSRLDLAREIKWGSGPLAYVALAQERAQGRSTFWWEYKLEVVRGAERKLDTMIELLQAMLVDPVASSLPELDAHDTDPND